MFGHTHLIVTGFHVIRHDVTSVAPIINIASSFLMIFGLLAEAAVLACSPRLSG
jgi:hypothetical protein